MVRVQGSKEGPEEMIICAAGDNHGAIDRLCSDIIDFEGALGVRFEVVQSLIPTATESKPAYLGQLVEVKNLRICSVKTCRIYFSGRTDGRGTAKSE